MKPINNLVPLVGLLVAVAWVICSNAAAIAIGAEPIAWKLTPGRSWRIETERVILTESTHPGAVSKVTSTTKLTSRIVIDSFADDLATITETVETIRASVEIASTP